MAELIRGNAVIGQSGGPTAVINQSLVGVVEGLRLGLNAAGIVERVYGMRHGVKGLVSDDLADLTSMHQDRLDRLAMTPSAGLGSTRDKPNADYCERILEACKRNNVRYFFYIGGNDSAETTNIVYQEALKANFAFRCFHICKTIDNDLRQNDHTPGFGSAAKFVAQAFMGDNLDNRSLPGVKINVVMGRHAGFLTGASALARVFPNDGPHLVYLPERPFVMEKFVADVKGVYEKLGRCVVAVSEGIADESGTSIIAKHVKEVDSHGNIQLSGSGALGDILADAIRATGITRVRADTFGYLQRSFPGVTSEVDAKEARAVGATAVKFAVKSHENGSVAIQRKKGKAYKVEFVRVPLESVAKETRHMPDEFITPAANDVTKAFLDYVKPIVGELPKTGRLKAVPAGKK